MTTPGASSLKQYQSCINRLTAEDIFPLLQKQPKLVVTWINQHASKSGSIDTQNTYINAILYHLRSKLPEGLYQTPSLSSALAVYTAESKRIQALRADKSKKQELPAAKMQQLMTWPEVTALKEKASALSDQDYLIYLLYTEMPPLRADFTDLFLATRDSKKRPGNFLVMPAKGKAKLVLQEYKTAKKYGRQVFTLPDSIKAQLNKIVTPTFEQSSILRMTPNLLGKKVSSIFEQLAGKRMSINLLRHAYIKHFLSKKRSIKEKEKLAAKMLHSTTLQEQYDLVPEEEEEGEAVWHV